MILVSVFLTGMAILIIEILATRILAPYFGNSIYTFSSVISIILAALSIGYYLGGRLSDWKLQVSIFYKIILLSGLAVLVLQLLTLSILPLLSYELSMISGPLVMSLLLFFLPAFALAVLSPYAIRLLQQQQTVEYQGRNIGNVFFWSTLGSIIGSLGAGFVLIPLFPIDTIIAYVAYGLLLLSGIGLFLEDRKNSKWLGLIAFIIIAHQIFLLIFVQKDPETVYEYQGLYEQISVVDKKINNRPVRILLQDKNTNSGMYLDTGKMFFDYTKYYELYKLFTPEAKRILTIGGGAYSVPKDIIENSSEIKIDAVEIEPGLYQIAKQYFSLPETTQLTNHIKDGRRFLHDTTQQYDVIFSDVYRSFASVPMHFSTQEFFQLTRNRLNDRGVFIANFFGSTANDSHSMIDSLVKTLSTVFSQYYVFAIVDPQKDSLQNFIFVGHNTDERVDLSQAKQIKFNFSELNQLVGKEYKIDKTKLSNAKIFTDQYAPIEFLAANIIRQYDDLLQQGKVFRKD